MDARFISFGTLLITFFHNQLHCMTCGTILNLHPTKFVVPTLVIVISAFLPAGKIGAMLHMMHCGKEFVHKLSLQCSVWAVPEKRTTILTPQSKLVATKLVNLNINGNPWIFPLLKSNNVVSVSLDINAISISFWLNWFVCCWWN